MGPTPCLAACLLVAITVSMGPTTAQGGVLYVNDDAAGANDGTSWASAFTSLQSALAAAQVGDQVWVATGTYKPSATADPTATYALKDGVAIYGGFAGTELTLADRVGLFEQTILSGDVGPADSHHVVTASGTGSTAVLDGFMVTSGHATVAVSGGGGGMLTSAASPTVRNCTFYSNRAAAGVSRIATTGGGVLVEGGNPQFSACTFLKNRAEGVFSFGFQPAGDARGGALCNLGGSPKLFACRFFGNEAIGGEAFKLGPPGAGQGGAVYSEGGHVTMEHCVVNGNVAAGGPEFGRAGPSSGGGLHCLGDATLSHCVFSGNATVEFGHFPDNGVGGAMWTQGHVIVGQCTISQNLAMTTPGVSVAGGTLTLRNGILWDNGTTEADQVHVAAGATLGVEHSCILGLTGALGGAGNIGSDPLFQDADGADNLAGTADDDLRLSAGSPCSDAADNLSVPPDVSDLDADGNADEPTPLDLNLKPRFSDDPAAPDTGNGVKPLVDIGSYEFQGEWCQWSLGFQGPGTVSLCLCGDDLTLAGSSATLLVTGAQPNSPLALFAGFTFDPTPFFSGTLVPVPPALTILFPSSGPAGSIAFPVPGAGGPTVIIYVQAAARNGTVIEFSNAIEVVIGT